MCCIASTLSSPLSKFPMAMIWCFHIITKLMPNHSQSYSIYHMFILLYYSYHIAIHVYCVCLMYHQLVLHHVCNKKVHSNTTHPKVRGNSWAPSSSAWSFKSWSARTSWKTSWRKRPKARRVARAGSEVLELVSRGGLWPWWKMERWTKQVLGLCLRFLLENYVVSCWKLKTKQCLELLNDVQWWRIKFMLRSTSIRSKTL